VENKVEIQKVNLDLDADEVNFLVSALDFLNRSEGLKVARECVYLQEKLLSKFSQQNEEKKVENEKE
jgi:hypothetical protein